jgi:hypothetical protein
MTELFVCNLFNYAVGVLDYILSSDKIINE